MVLPSTIATIGTTATPVSGTTPETNSRGSTAIKPSARDTISKGDPRLAWLRRAAVTLATTNMTAKMSIDDHNRVMAAANTPRRRLRGREWTQATRRYTKWEGCVAHMTTVRQVAQQFERGGINFDELLADVAARDWPVRKPADTLAEIEERADAWPDDDDIVWLDGLVFRDHIDMGQRAGIVTVIRKPKIDASPRRN